MSRIGKKPISIPAGVEVTLAPGRLQVKGPKGALELGYGRAVAVTKEEQNIIVQKKMETKEARAIWGTTAKLIENMLVGVTAGFQKQLELNGVGFRMSVSGKKMTLALGFSHPVVMEIPQGLEAIIENNVLTIAGIDKQRVGEFAAVIRKLKKVEPYKGKGFRYVGEVVRRKEGKKAAA